MVYFLPLLSNLFFLLAPSSTSQPTELFFPGFSPTKSHNLTLTGAANIGKNGILCLTNDTGPLLGHAFYSSPLRLKSSTQGKAFSFSTSFAFAIVPEYPGAGLGGHGLAFVITTSKDLKALPRQYLGIQNATENGDSPYNHELVAVEFDTVQDLEFLDIDDNHVGIDINSLNSNASVTASYYTEGSTKQNLTLMSGKAIQAWVDYDSVGNILNVTIAPNSTRPRLPILSFHVDLSPFFHEFMYVGFSASTGLLASSHYILGWSFKINGGAQGLDLSSLPSLPVPPKKHTALIVDAAVPSAILVILAVSIAIYFTIKIMKDDVIEDWELEVGPKRYSYQELKQATKGFRANNLLGHGSFGRVYRGKLRGSKTQVAVKRVSHESKQGLREFLSEISSIGRLRHRNLVQLLGWCRRRGDLLLVYEFMANGSLDKFLFDEPKTTLNWGHRFRVISGVAYGLLYLHEGYEQVVIHRDVKASNVLLDDELNGKLGDFGLARLYEHGSNLRTTRVVGTLGYLAPEVSRTGKATTSSDVYAFGALLLEVVCGRRPIEPKALPLESGLVDWVWKKYREGRVFDVVDTRLNGQYVEDEMLMVLKLGLICSHDVPVARPSMRQVVRYLDGEAELPDLLRL
ncbi:hypothetical protein V6N13_140792 [Hibiscus sabdariffa]|uniref:non-specific serine/threonine protein kinase n=1 Tax=Hibiscus sabdariffa TaxID=183260 RepID=A0ABR2Q2E0_9ROSI